ncbi:hypothetical protein HDK90DRAFT_490647 [Phyllosticta capitalensis]|uniref:Secreted protein n=1 Tax=Phyllosticta capitalensis TaxID=121624 RepID=A0ABR1YHU0_9PEZI
MMSLMSLMSVISLMARLSTKRTQRIQAATHATEIHVATTILEWPAIHHKSGERRLGKAEPPQNASHSLPGAATTPASASLVRCWSASMDCTPQEYTLQPPYQVASD